MLSVKEKKKNLKTAAEPEANVILTSTTILGNVVVVAVVLPPPTTPKNCVADNPATVGPTGAVRLPWFG